MKNKILDKATKLFNENGINNTSFRDIAEILNISDGHVRYYFKTKEILLMAIFEKLDNEIIQAANVPILFDKNLQVLLKKNMETVIILTVKYRFLFVESPQTISQYPNLLKSYRNLLSRRKKMIFGIFEMFEKMNLFNARFDQVAKEHVFHTLFIVSDGWLRSYQLTNAKLPTKKAIEFHSNLIVNILSPYMNVCIS